MKIDTLPIGLYDENVYVLHDKGHVLVIDPGRHVKLISAKIEKDEKVDAVLLTHGHYDHTGAADDISELYDCPIYIHPADHTLASVQGNAFNGGNDVPVYAPMNDLTEGEMTIGAFKLRVYSTPGHTDGSVLIKYKDIMFTGDTLFAQTIGRTDLYSGSEEKMLHSLGMIRNLPNDIKIYPGHGEASTIGHEKKVNPYLNLPEPSYSM